MKMTREELLRLYEELRQHGYSPEHIERAVWEMYESDEPRGLAAEIADVIAAKIGRADVNPLALIEELHHAIPEMTRTSSAQAAQPQPQPQPKQVRTVPVQQWKQAVLEDPRVRALIKLRDVLRPHLAAEGIDPVALWAKTMRARAGGSSQELQGILQTARLAFPNVPEGELWSAIGELASLSYRHPSGRKTAVEYPIEQTVEIAADLAVRMAEAGIFGRHSPQEVFEILQKSARTREEEETVGLVLRLGAEIAQNVPLSTIERIATVAARMAEAYGIPSRSAALLPGPTVVRVRQTPQDAASQKEATVPEGVAPEDVLFVEEEQEAASYPPRFSTRNTTMLIGGIRHEIPWGNYPMPEGPVYVAETAQDAARAIRAARKAARSAAWFREKASAADSVERQRKYLAKYEKQLQEFSQAFAQLPYEQQAELYASMPEAQQVAVASVFERWKRAGAILQMGGIRVSEMEHEIRRGLGQEWYNAPEPVLQYVAGKAAEYIRGTGMQVGVSISQAMRKKTTESAENLGVNEEMLMAGAYPFQASSGDRMVIGIDLGKVGKRWHQALSTSHVYVPGRESITMISGEEAQKFRVLRVWGPASVLLSEGQGLASDFPTYTNIYFRQRAEREGEVLLKVGQVLTGEELKDVRVASTVAAGRDLSRYQMVRVLSIEPVRVKGESGREWTEYAVAVQAYISQEAAKGAASKSSLYHTNLSWYIPEELQSQIGDVDVILADTPDWALFSAAWAAANPQKYMELTGASEPYIHGRTLPLEHVEKISRYLQKGIREITLRARVAGRIQQGKFVPYDEAIAEGIKAGTIRVVEVHKPASGSVTTAVVEAGGYGLAADVVLQLQEAYAWRNKRILSREVAQQVVGKEEYSRALWRARSFNEAYRNLLAVAARIFPQEWPHEPPPLRLGRFADIAEEIKARVSEILATVGRPTPSQSRSALLLALTQVMRSKGYEALEFDRGQVVPRPDLFGRLVGWVGEFDEDEAKVPGERITMYPLARFVETYLRSTLGYGQAPWEEEKYGSWEGQKAKTWEQLQEHLYRVAASRTLARRFGGAAVSLVGGGVIVAEAALPPNLFYASERQLRNLIPRGKLTEEQYETLIRNIISGKQRFTAKMSGVPFSGGSGGFYGRYATREELIAIGIPEEQINIWERRGLVAISPVSAYANARDFDVDPNILLGEGRVDFVGDEVQYIGPAPTPAGIIVQEASWRKETESRVRKAITPLTREDVLRQKTSLRLVSKQEVIDAMRAAEENRQMAGPSYNALIRSLGTGYQRWPAVMKRVVTLPFIGTYQQSIDQEAIPPELEPLVGVLTSRAAFERPIQGIERYSLTVALRALEYLKATPRQMALFMADPTRQGGKARLKEVEKILGSGELPQRVEALLQYYRQIGLATGAPEREAVAAGIARVGGFPYAALTNLLYQHHRRGNVLAPETAEMLEKYFGQSARALAARMTQYSRSPERSLADLANAIQQSDLLYELVYGSPRQNQQAPQASAMPMPEPDQEPAMPQPGSQQAARGAAAVPQPDIATGVAPSAQADTAAPPHIPTPVITSQIVPGGAVAAQTSAPAPQPSPSVASVSPQQMGSATQQTGAHSTTATQQPASIPPAGAAAPPVAGQATSGGGTGSLPPHISTPSMAADEEPIPDSDAGLTAVPDSQQQRLDRWISRISRARSLYGEEGGIRESLAALRALMRQLNIPVRIFFGGKEEPVLTEDVLYTVRAAIRGIYSGEIRHTGELAHLIRDIPQKSVRSTLASILKSVRTGQPLTSTAIELITAALGPDEAQEVAGLDILREQAVEKARRTRKAYFSESEEARAALKQFTEDVRRAAQAAKGFHEILSELGSGDEAAGRQRYQAARKIAARIESAIRASPPREAARLAGEYGEFLGAVGLLDEADLLADLTGAGGGGVSGRRQASAQPWFGPGGRLGQAFHRLTSGWGIFWLSRWWNLTGGAVMRSMEEYAEQEQMLQRILWVAGGTAPQIAPEAAQLMEFRARLSAARTAMGRAAWQAYGAGILRPVSSVLEPLAEIGGLALPWAGVSGVLLGGAAIAGLIGWGTALSIGLPVTAAGTVLGLGLYANQLQREPLRYQIALAGHGSPLENFAARLTVRPILLPSLTDSVQSSAAIAAQAQLAERAEEARRAAEAEYRRMLTPEVWRTLSPEQQSVLLRAYFRDLAAKGQPLARWKLDEQILPFVSGYIARVRQSPVEIPPEIIDWFLASGISPEQGQTLARALNIPLPTLPQAVAGLGGIQGLNVAAEAVDRYYSGFLRWGVEPMRLYGMIASGQLPEQIPASLAYRLERLAAGDARTVSQVAFRMGRYDLMQTDLFGMRLGVIAPLPIGRAQVGFANRLRTSRVLVEDILAGRLEPFGIWGEDTLWGLQDRIFMENLAYQRQQAALSRRQLQLQAGWMRTQWRYEDMARQAEWAQMMGGTTPGGLQMVGHFNWQLRGLEMNFRQFLENWELAMRNAMRQRIWQEQDWAYTMWRRGFARETEMLQRAWTREDWGIQAARSGIEFGWALEDIEEAIRYSTGLQRRRLLRERQRLITRYGWQQEDRERAQERQEEIWRRQDEMWRRETQHLEEQMRRQQELFDLDLERLELQRRHAEEDRDFRRSQIEESRAFWQENYERQSELIGLQRQHQLAQLELQKQQLELSQRHAEAIANLQLEMTKLSRAMELFGEQAEQKLPSAFQYALAEMLKALDRWVKEMQTGFGSLPRPTGYGWAGAPQER